MRRFGNTVPLKIGGARNVDQRKLAERSGDQPGIRQWSHAQNAIDTLFDKIDGAISHSQMYIDFRIGIQKLGQGWRDDQTSDAAGNVDPQRAGWRRGIPKQIFRFLHIRNQTQASFIEGGAILRRRHASGGPVEEPRPEAPLQLENRRRNRGTRHAERIGGARKTRTFDDTGEDTKEVDAIQDNLPPLSVKPDRCCQNDGLYSAILDDTLRI